MNSPSKPQSVYKKLTQEELKRVTLSQQNYHVAVGYECLNDALLNLFQKKLTVASVHIEGAQPVITLLQPPRQGLLSSQVCRLTNQATGRKEAHVAIINGCRVVWEQPIRQEIRPPLREVRHEH